MNHLAAHQEDIAYGQRLAALITKQEPYMEIVGGTISASTSKEHNALAVQIGGDHYKTKAIQPIEYIHANNMNFIEGSIVKYITRWREKGGLNDLQKIKHYVDLLVELEGRKK